MVFLTNQIAALTQRIAEERDALTGTNSEQAQLGRVLHQYEELQLELEFAQKSYATASATLEFAQVNATKQQLYITPIDKPKLPEYARYPNRPLNILLAALIFFIFWAIGVLLYNSLRDRVL